VVVAGKVVGVEVTPDNQAAVVDATCKGTADAEGIVEGGVGAAVGIEDIAVVATVLVTERPDDLVRIVDAACVDVADVGRGTVEGCGSIDGHDTAPLRWPRCAQSIDRQAKSQSNPLGLSCISRNTRALLE